MPGTPNVPLAAPQIQQPDFLFGHYFVEMAKWLAKFQGYNQNAETQYLQVLYGVPSAAWRKVTQTTNGVMNLPVINFFVADFKQDFSMENPFASHTGSWANDNVKKLTSRERAPQHWDLTYSVNLWTSSLTTRDDLMGKIMRQFQAGHLALKFYPDTTRWPNVFMWMPIYFDGSFQDATNVDDVPGKETRDVIRTTFNLRGHCVLPYYSKIVPRIEKIQLDETVRADIEQIYTSGQAVDVIDPNSADYSDKWQITVLSNPGEDLVFSVTGPPYF